MQVVWLRATFFMASSSYPHKSTHTPAACRTGGSYEEQGGEIRVHMGARTYEKEGGGWTSNSFPSLPVADKNGLGELKKCGGESPQPWGRYSAHLAPCIHCLTSPHPSFSSYHPYTLPSHTCFQVELQKGHGGSSSWGCWGREIKSQKNKQKKEKYLQSWRQLAMVSHLRCLIWCVLAARWETRVPGMGAVHQKRRRFSLHAKNSSLTAQLSNPHQHFLMIILSDCTAKKYLALVIPTH